MPGALGGFASSYVASSFHLNKKVFFIPNIASLVGGLFGLFLLPSSSSLYLTCPLLIQVLDLTKLCPSFTRLKKTHNNRALLPIIITRGPHPILNSTSTSRFPTAGSESPKSPAEQS